MPYDYIKEFGDWQPYQKMVQNDLKDKTDFYTAKTTLLAAGPPTLDPLITPEIRGLGLVESAALTQNLALHTIYEIGSDFQIDVAGRNIPALMIGRLFTYQPNLLALCYNYYWAADDDFTPEVPYHIEGGMPNSAGVWMNLGSVMFKYPFGLMLIFATDEELEDGVGIDVQADFYLESCHITGHQLGINAGAVTLMESCSIKPARVTPIEAI